MNFLPAALVVCFNVYMSYAFPSNKLGFAMAALIGGAGFLALGIYQTERTKK